MDAGRRQRTRATFHSRPGKPYASIRSVSVHTDGKRLAYSRNENTSDILLLDGLPRPGDGLAEAQRARVSERAAARV